MPFDPDAYLKKKQPVAVESSFDPDAYLSRVVKPAPAPAAPTLSEEDVAAGRGRRVSAPRWGNLPSIETREADIPAEVLALADKPNPSRKDMKAAGLPSMPAAKRSEVAAEVAKAKATGMWGSIAQVLKGNEKGMWGSIAQVLKGNEKGMDSYVAGIADIVPVVGYGGSLGTQVRQQNEQAKARLESGDKGYDDYVGTFTRTRDQIRSDKLFKAGSYGVRPSDSDLSRSIDDGIEQQRRRIEKVSKKRPLRLNEITDALQAGVSPDDMPGGRAAVVSRLKEHDQQLIAEVEGNMAKAAGPKTVAGRLAGGAAGILAISSEYASPQGLVNKLLLDPAVRAQEKRGPEVEIDDAGRVTVTKAGKDVSGVDVAKEMTLGTIDVAVEKFLDKMTLGTGKALYRGGKAVAPTAVKGVVKAAVGKVDDVVMRAMDLPAIKLLNNNPLSKLYRGFKNSGAIKAVEKATAIQGTGWEIGEEAVQALNQVLWNVEGDERPIGKRLAEEAIDFAKNAPYLVGSIMLANVLKLGPIMGVDYKIRSGEASKDAPVFKKALEFHGVNVEEKELKTFLKGLYGAEDAAHGLTSVNEFLERHGIAGDEGSPIVQQMHRAFSEIDKTQHPRRRFLRALRDATDQEREVVMSRGMNAVVPEHEHVAQIVEDPAMSEPVNEKEGAAIDSVKQKDPEGFAEYVEAAGGNEKAAVHVMMADVIQDTEADETEGKLEAEAAPVSEADIQTDMTNGDMALDAEKYMPNYPDEEEVQRAFAVDADRVLAERAKSAPQAAVNPLLEGTESVRPKNRKSIATMERVLRTGKLNGKNQTPTQLDRIRTHVNKWRKSIGEAETTATLEEAKPKREKKFTADGKEILPGIRQESARAIVADLKTIEIDVMGEMNAQANPKDKRRQKPARRAAVVKYVRKIVGNAQKIGLNVPDLNKETQLNSKYDPTAISKYLAEVRNAMTELQKTMHFDPAKPKGDVNINKRVEKYIDTDMTPALKYFAENGAIAMPDSTNGKGEWDTVMTELDGNLRKLVRYGVLRNDGKGMQLDDRMGDMQDYFGKELTHDELWDMVLDDISNHEAAKKSGEIKMWAEFGDDALTMIQRQKEDEHWEKAATAEDRDNKDILDKIASGEVFPAGSLIRAGGKLIDVGTHRFEVIDGKYTMVYVGLDEAGATVSVPVDSDVELVSEESIGFNPEDLDGYENEERAPDEVQTGDAGRGREGDEGAGAADLDTDADGIYRKEERSGDGSDTEENVLGDPDEEIYFSIRKGKATDEKAAEAETTTEAADRDSGNTQRNEALGAVKERSEAQIARQAERFANTGTEGERKMWAGVSYSPTIAASLEFQSISEAAAAFGIQLVPVNSDAFLAAQVGNTVYIADVAQAEEHLRHELFHVADESNNRHANDIILNVNRKSPAFAAFKTALTKAYTSRGLKVPTDNTVAKEIAARFSEVGADPNAEVVVGSGLTFADVFSDGAAAVESIGAMMADFGTGNISGANDSLNLLVATAEDVEELNLKGVSHADIDKMRAYLGLDERTPTEIRKDQEVADEVDAQYRAEAQAGRMLVDYFKANPEEAPTDVQTVMLIQERIMTEARLGRAQSSGDHTAAAAAEAYLVEIAGVADRMGTASGRALRARRLLMGEDLSDIYLMQYAFQKANKGKGPTDSDKDAIAALKAKFDALEKEKKEHEEQAAKAIKEQEEEIAKAAAMIEWLKFVDETLNADVPFSEKLDMQADEMAADALAVIRSAHTRMYSVGDASIVAAYVKLGASMLMKQGATAAKWMETMKAEAEANGHSWLNLKEVFGQAVALRDKIIGRKQEPKPKPESKPKPSSDEDGGERGGTSIKALFRMAVENGATTLDEAVAEVFDIVQDDDKYKTPEDVRDAFSGYGKAFKTDRDAIDRIISDLRRQAQLIAAIEDAMDGIAPSKSGPQREKATQRVRELQKQLKAMMKELGIETRDPEAQLASALQAAKTRMSNAIEDLEAAIAENKRMVRVKKGMKPDDELEALTRRRDELKKKYDEKFPKEPVTDDERILIALAAAEKSLRENEQALKDARSGKFADKAAKRLPFNARLNKLRADRDAIKKEITELKEAAFPGMAAVEAKKRRLQSAITEMQRRIREKDFKPKERKDVDISKDPEAMRLQAELAEVRREWAEMKEEIRRRNRQPTEVRSEWLLERMDDQRNILASFDFSAAGRQGWYMLLSHPLLGMKATARMFRAWKQGNSAVFAQELRERENWKNGVYKRARLGLVDDNGTGNFSDVEDRFKLNKLDKIPGIPASNRAYATFLNTIRADVFDRLLTATKNPADTNTDKIRALATGVNILSGRGEFKKQDPATLAHYLWAPRFLKAAFDTLGFIPMRRGPREIKMLFVREYGRALGSLFLIYLLNALFNDEPVELDPRSSDFGAIPLGRHRFNPIGWVRPLITFAARVGTGVSVTSKGKRKLRETGLLEGDQDELKEEKVAFGSDLFDVIARFAQSKAHPAIGVGLSVLTQKNFDGTPVTKLGLVKDMTIPLALRESYRIMSVEDSDAAYVLTAMSMLGVSVQPDYDDPRFIKQTSKGPAEYKKALGKILIPGTSPNATEADEKRMRKLLGKLPKEEARDALRESLKARGMKPKMRTPNLTMTAYGKRMQAMSREWEEAQVEK